MSDIIFELVLYKRFSENVNILQRVMIDFTIFLKR